jgi:hypothetical protein
LINGLPVLAAWLVNRLAVNDLQPMNFGDCLLKALSVHRIASEVKLHQTLKTSDRLQQGHLVCDVIVGETQAHQVREVPREVRQLSQFVRRQVQLLQELVR